MKILVLGAGAIGLVFGGFMARASHRVVLLGREELIGPVREQGLRIEGIWGDHWIGPLPGFSDLLTLKKTEGIDFDLVLLTVKSYDTARVLNDFRETFPDPIPVLSLQNGVGNLELAAQILGREQAMAGRVIFGAETSGPGTVRVTVYAEAVRIGGLPDGIAYGTVERVARAINDTGIPCLPTAEIERFIWGKMLYNCALNGLASILGRNYGALLEAEGTRNLMAGIVREVFMVLERRNIRVDWADSERYIQDLFGRLIPATADHFPSMLRDLQNGKRTEIDALNGAIVEIARGCGFDVPINWLITKLVKVKEKMALGTKDLPEEKG